MIIPQTLTFERLGNIPSSWESYKRAPWKVSNRFFNIGGKVGVGSDLVNLLLSTSLCIPPQVVYSF